MPKAPKPTLAATLPAVCTAPASVAAVTAPPPTSAAALAALEATIFLKTDRTTAPVAIVPAAPTTPEIAPVITFPVLDNPRASRDPLRE